MNSGMRECEANHLKIPDVPPEVGTAITGFYYGLDLEIAPRNLLPTLVTIDRLQLSELVDVSCEHLKEALDPNNALDLASGIAEGCPWLLTNWLPLCSAYISRNQEAIARAGGVELVIAAMLAHAQKKGNSGDGAPSVKLCIGHA